MQDFVVTTCVAINDDKLGSEFILKFRVKPTNTKPQQMGHNAKRMMTSSNGNIFRITGLCVGNSTVTGQFPSQRPVARSFDVIFHLRLNKRLSKQS